MVREAEGPVPLYSFHPDVFQCVVKKAGVEGDF
jgi:hypothetical protein